MSQNMKNIIKVLFTRKSFDKGATQFVLFVKEAFHSFSNIYLHLKYLHLSSHSEIIQICLQTRYFIVLLIVIVPLIFLVHRVNLKYR